MEIFTLSKFESVFLFLNITYILVFSYKIVYSIIDNSLVIINFLKEYFI